MKRWVAMPVIRPHLRDELAVMVLWAVPAFAGCIYVSTTPKRRCRETLGTSASRNTVSQPRTSVRSGILRHPVTDNRLTDSHSEHCTNLLRKSLSGDEPSMQELAALTYDDLRRQARRLLGSKTPTIDATALVHDTYVRLVDQRNQDWRSQSHFAAISSTMLRRVFVDALRAGGRRARERQATLSTLDVLAEQPNSGLDVLDLDAALEEFAEVDPQAARMVELRCFGGLTIREVAAELGIARSSAQDVWTFARTWLGRRLRNAQ